MCLLRDGTCLKIWATPVPMHFRSLWFTLMPTIFHSFHTPLHCGILPSQQKLRICPQQNCRATKWQGGSLWGGIVGDDCRNYLITIATLHQSSYGVCLKGSKVNIEYRLHFFAKILCKPLWCVFIWMHSMIKALLCMGGIER